MEKIIDMAHKLKITVLKRLANFDLAREYRKAEYNQKYPLPCDSFEDGQEFIAENSFKMPEGFCGWAWRDLTVRLTKFDLIDMDWPGPNVTYVACGDGVRPVIFKLEKLED